MSKMLRNVQKQREQELHEWKAENLITPKDLLKYGQSQHVQGLLSVFSSLTLTSPPSQDKSSKQTHIHCRNYLMMMLTMANACRASNIMNITLYDLN